MTSTTVTAVNRSQYQPNPANGPQTEPLPLDVVRQRIADLAPDRDSYGGDPPTSVARTEAIRWAEIVADLFEPRVGSAARPYSVAPLADGGVQIEWRGTQGLVELEVGPDGALGYLFVPIEANGSQSDETDDASWSDVLRALLRAFVSQTTGPLMDGFPDDELICR